jgi:hypothetical protein
MDMTKIFAAVLFGGIAGSFTCETVFGLDEPISRNAVIQKTKSVKQVPEFDKNTLSGVDVPTRDTTVQNFIALVDVTVTKYNKIQSLNADTDVGAYLRKVTDALIALKGVYYFKTETTGTEDGVAVEACVAINKLIAAVDKDLKTRGLLP